MSKTTLTVDRKARKPRPARNGFPVRAAAAAGSIAAAWGFFMVAGMPALVEPMAAKAAHSQARGVAPLELAALPRSAAFFAQRQLPSVEHRAWQPSALPQNALITASGEVITIKTAKPPRQPLVADRFAARASGVQTARTEPNAAIVATILDASVEQGTELAFASTGFEGSTADYPSVAATTLSPAALAQSQPSRPTRQVELGDGPFALVLSEPDADMGAVPLPVTRPRRATGAPATALAYAAPDSGITDVTPRYREPEAPATASGRTAVYSIEDKTVFMPNGERLEAHSGLGPMLDNPRYVHKKMRGATPPHTYNLTMREALFHGVEAIRLNPVDPRKIFGRDGLLAHTYMLGPRGDSNGCLVFKNYKRFLAAFKRGEVRQLVVVARLPGGTSSRIASR
ncbi:DUF2778 domain-containing protein [Phyllobacterium sp. 0TCS1.6C]|uniref:DUF2778 domain-containing protein n=1 Tax=unclassified Phyllobacterium TaxID=2638441 RepID=UPI0022648AC8|nr:MULTISPECIES: DUF2778 domain-containing protein [unclassified Phyllobacterium]MCX8281845.1 DUF2778 domain-containing protein [Phyllobacterium sp. 0TCS1.6C]MCX8295380.1 DUF2778 domain-containing protein [Phyllobacterium sp. 0TCS1.6A]